MTWLENIPDCFLSFKHKSATFQGEVLTWNIADAYTGGFLF